MSKFFKRAIFYNTLAIEKYNIMKTGKDEEENMAVACYYLQTSLEFMLKGTLEYFSNEEIDFKKLGHKLIQSLSKVKDIGNKIKNYDELLKILNDLEPFCNEFSVWNEEARYNFNFVTTINLMDKAIEISDKYIKWINSTIPNIN